MTTKNKKNRSSIINQIIVATVIALFVGGTSPWWWVEIFGSKSGSQTTENVQEPPNGTSGEEDPSENIGPKIWKTGTLTIPLNNSNSGEVADLDNGRLLRLGTSIPAAGADISIRQSVHSIILEPGLSKGDGITFDARFIAVNDSPVGKEGCLASLVSPEVSNHLQLSSVFG